MRVLVVGSRGLAGGAVSLRAAELGMDIVELDRGMCDLTKLDQVREAIREHRPDCVVHAAGMMGIPDCEQQPDAAHLQNAVSARNVALAAQSCGAATVYFSGNVVFAGAGREHPYAYRETDTPAPMNVFAASKLAGEQSVIEQTHRHFIVRTAWLYGQRRHPGRASMVDRVLDAARQGNPLTMVSDQWANPTLAADLADAVLRLVRLEAYGTYHLVNTEPTTPYDFSKAVLAAAGLTGEVAAVQQSGSQPVHNLALHNEFARSLGIEMRPWSEALAEALK